jgi:hypothetical protein
MEGAENGDKAMSVLDAMRGHLKKLIQDSRKQSVFLPHQRLDDWLMLEGRPGQ